MAQIDEVLGRLDFQKNKLAEASKDGNPASVGKVVYELIDTMQQLAGIVKEHVERPRVARIGGSSETF